VGLAAANQDRTGAAVTFLADDLRPGGGGVVAEVVRQRRECGGSGHAVLAAVDEEADVGTHGIRGQGAGGRAQMMSSRRPPPAPSPLRSAPSLESYQPVIRLRPAVAEELPRVPHLADLVEVELRGDEGVLVALGLRQELPARIAEVALPVKLADVPRPFEADAVDGADEVAVGDGVRRLLELPEVLGEPGDGGGRVEHDLRAGEAELS